MIIKVSPSIYLTCFLKHHYFTKFIFSSEQAENQSNFNFEKSLKTIKIYVEAKFIKSLLFLILLTVYDSILLISIIQIQLKGNKTNKCFSEKFYEK